MSEIHRLQRLEYQLLSLERMGTAAAGLLWLGVGGSSGVDTDMLTLLISLICLCEWQIIIVSLGFYYFSCRFRSKMKTEMVSRVMTTQ